MKLKGVLSGKFTPRSLGLKNTDRNSKVSDVVLCYRNRFGHTLKTLIKDKETKNFSESGIHGSNGYWYTHISTDGGIIPLGPFKTAGQILSVQESINSYRSGAVTSIKDITLLLKSNKIHPSIIQLLSIIFPDQE